MKKALGSLIAFSLILALSGILSPVSAQDGNGSDPAKELPSLPPLEPPSEVLPQEEPGDASAGDVAQQLQSLTDGKIRVSTHAQTGKVRFIGTELPRPLRQTTVMRANTAPNAKADPEEAARSFLSAYGNLFGLRDQSTELQVARTDAIDDSRHSVRFQQAYEGIPILGGELVVQLSTLDNGIISVNGEILPGISVDTTPAVPAGVARETALTVVAEEYGLDPSGLTASEPQLRIYNPAIMGGDQGPAQLVWQLEVTPLELLPVREFVLVDARFGAVALRFNQIQSAKNLEVYTAYSGGDCTSALPGTLVRSEGGPVTGDADVDAAYDKAGFTYDYYLTEHGRDSIDGAGMTIVSTVDFDLDGGCDFANAFWTGSQMVYGNGLAQALDVVAHEITHGVTQYESNLFYYMQSGAINESLSDIWGEFTELTYDPGDPADRWLLGEDSASGANRDMENPPAFGDPDKMTSPLYYYGTDD